MLATTTERDIGQIARSKEMIVKQPRWSQRRDDLLDHTDQISEVAIPQIKNKGFRDLKRPAKLLRSGLFTQTTLNSGYCHVLLTPQTTMVPLKKWRMPHRIGATISEWGPSINSGLRA